MNYLRNGAVLGLVVLLTFSGTTFASAQDSDAFVPGSMYDEVELMPYPTLAGPLSLHAVGPSGEFTSSQEAESESSGMAILNWTHTPGVELQYNTSGYYPICMEYASFAENFSWIQNVQPSALRVSGDIQIDEAGSFQTDSWSNMFDVRIWILGDAIQKHEIAGVSSVQGYQHFSMTIFGYQDAFDELIQHPEDHLQLAVALVPNRNFMEYQGTHPWMDYTGSVEVITREIHLSALYRTNPDLPHIRAATFNSTWRIGQSDDFVDSCIARDGSLYILSHQQFSNYIQGDTLTRVNSTGKTVRILSLSSPNLVTWNKVLASSNAVFLFGTYYYGAQRIMTVDMVGENGTLSHAFNLNLTAVANVGGIDISPDGYLYIGTGGSGSGKINMLRKVSLDGTIQWERSFGDDRYGLVISVQTDGSGDVFTFSQGQITKWNSQGDQLWQLSNLDNSLSGAKSFFALRDGSSIIIASQLRNSTIALVSSEGSQEWAFSYQIQYAPDWIEALYIPWITESPSGVLYALFTTYDLHQSTIIVVLNRAGAQVGNFTASFGRETYSSAEVPNYRRVYFTDENLMYLVGRVVDEQNYHSLTLAIYGSEPITLGGLEVSLLFTSAATGVIVGVLVYLEHYRKGRTTE